MLAFVSVLVLALAACWGPPGQGAARTWRAASHARSEARSPARRRAGVAGGEAPPAAASGPGEPLGAAPGAPAPAAAPRVVAGAPAGPGEAEATRAVAGEAEAAPAVVDRVSLGGGAFLLVPAGLEPDGAPYDLVVHFHGVAPPLERALGASGLRAVVVDVNVGAGSGPYATIVREGVVGLDAVVGKVERTMARRSPGFASARVGRVALSAWSAGYGSVLRLLASPRAAARVDAVLLADAPHAGFRDPARRQVDGAGLEPLVAFGRRALRGEALLAITHSEIATVGYASTRESADFLLRSLGLARRPGSRPGPGRMVRTSLVEAGDFSLAGYEGVDAAAHGDHLRHLDATLFPRLRRRWGAPAAAPAERRAALAAPAPG